MRPVTASSWRRAETMSNGQRINGGTAVAAPTIDGAALSEITLAADPAPTPVDAVVDAIVEAVPTAASAR